MFSFWLELVTYLERYASVMCEKLRIKPNVHSVFSLAVFFSVRGYSCTTAGLHLGFLSVLLSLIPSESSRY